MPRPDNQTNSISIEQNQNLQRIAPSAFSEGKFRNDWKQLLNAYALGDIASSEELLFSDGRSNIDIFKYIPVEPQPIAIKQKTIKKICDRHDISLSQLSELEQWFKQTPLVLDSLSQKDAFVIFADATDTDGNEIIVALQLNKEAGQKNFEVTLDEITSIYGKENIDYLIENTFNADKRIIVNENTRAWLRHTGVSFPQPLAKLIKDNDITSSIECQKNNLSSIEDNIKDIEPKTESVKSASVDNAKPVQTTEQLNLPVTLTLGQALGGKSSEYIEILERLSDKEIEQPKKSTLFDKDALITDPVLGEQVSSEEWKERKEQYLNDKAVIGYYNNRSSEQAKQEYLLYVTEMRAQQEQQRWQEMLQEMQASVICRVGFSENWLASNLPKNLSFGLYNAILGEIDTQLRCCSGYDKTNFEIHAKINGEPFDYKGQYDLGDNIGSLVGHIARYRESQVQLAEDKPDYLSQEELNREKEILEKIVPELKKLAELTPEEKEVFDKFKSSFAVVSQLNNDFIAHETFQGFYPYQLPNGLFVSHPTFDRVAQDLFSELYAEAEEKALEVINEFAGVEKQETKDIEQNKQVDINDASDKENNSPEVPPSENSISEQTDKQENKLIDKQEEIGLNSVGATESVANENQQKGVDEDETLLNDTLRGTSGREIPLSGGQSPRDIRGLQDNAGTRRVLRQSQTVPEVYGTQATDNGSVVEGSRAGDRNSNESRPVTDRHIHQTHEHGHLDSGESSTSRDSGELLAQGKGQIETNLDAQIAVSPLERAEKNIEALRVRKNIIERAKNAQSLDSLFVAKPYGWSEKQYVDLLRDISEKNCAELLNPVTTSDVHSGDVLVEDPITSETVYEEEWGELSDRYLRDVATFENYDTLAPQENGDLRATKEEQEILAQYSGWGGAARAFDENERGAWAQYREDLKELLSESEYEAARASVLTAYYTPASVVDSVFSTLKNMGVGASECAHILEPGCGTGNFLRSVPAGMSAKVTGVEIDSISASIASLISPDNCTVVNDDISNCDISNNSFDCVVGNVPYDKDTRIDGQVIHDYFIDRSIDSLRAGGVAALLTSRFTMDKTSTAFRTALAQKAELIGAARLPQETFEGQAGTSVISDLLFFRKRETPLSFEEAEEEPWVKTVDFDGVPINAYFDGLEGNYRVAGVMSTTTGRFGQTLSVKAIDPDLRKGIRGALHSQPVWQAEVHGNFEDGLGKRASVPAVRPRPEKNVVSCTYEFDDKGDIWFHGKEGLEPFVAKDDKQAVRAKDLLALRNSVRDLLLFESEPSSSDEDVEAKIKQVKQEYDAFVKKHGYVNSTANKRVFSAKGKPIDGSMQQYLYSLELAKDKNSRKFSFDASEFIQAQENTDVVVFEYLKQSDVDVATHTDIDDENQTFTIIPSEIGTTLTDKSDGDHVILPSQTITLTDHVTYTGLIVGKEYTLTGYLMNKDTGERLMINDREISATTTFTPNDTNGSVVIDFTFDASGLENGQEVVAFEYLSKNGVEVATHTDIEDKAQTVKVERSYESVIDKTGSDGSNGSSTPKTGDMLMWAVALLCVLGAVSGGFVFARRRGLIAKLDKGGECNEQ